MQTADQHSDDHQRPDGAIMMKGPILQKRWDKLSQERQEQILQQAQELEQEYITLQELRKERELTHGND